MPAFRALRIRLAGEECWWLTMQESVLVLLISIFQGKSVAAGTDHAVGEYDNIALGFSRWERKWRLRNHVGLTRFHSTGMDFISLGRPWPLGSDTAPLSSSSRAQTIRQARLHGRLPAAQTKTAGYFQQSVPFLSPMFSFSFCVYFR